MKCFAVLDTNILVSALIKIKSPPGIVLLETLSDEGRIIPVVSERVLTEYQVVLGRDKFAFPIKVQQELLNYFNKYSFITNESFLDPDSLQKLVKDKKDVPFFEAGMTTMLLKQGFFITGNIKHFPTMNNLIVSPRVMVEKLRSKNNIRITALLESFEKDFKSTSKYLIEMKETELAQKQYNFYENSR